MPRDYKRVLEAKAKAEAEGSRRRDRHPMMEALHG